MPELEGVVVSGGVLGLLSGLFGSFSGVVASGAKDSGVVDTWGVVNCSTIAAKSQEAKTVESTKSSAIRIIRELRKNFIFSKSPL